jgi:acetyltransferase
LNSLKNLFAPESIAVIGASRREGTLGRMFLDAIVQMNYKGITYPVNPKADKINNLDCYPDIASLPDIPDLAIILLPKEMVFKTIEEVAEKGICNVVVISAGFKETGDEGKTRETELLELTHRYNIRMIGPNSMGLFNTAPDLSLNATFSPTAPIPGHVGFISQSGALGVAVLELSLKMGMGFSSFVSTGNKADVGDVDCLRFLADDENTKAVILYQEVIDNPPEFRNICQYIVQNKPVLTLKAGRTKSGLKAATSHTGALASDDILTDAFLKQCGVIRCQTLEELLESALVLTSQPMPSGKRVGVVTNAGGPGILVSDALENHGLELGKISDESRTALSQILPAEAGLDNPVDMIASATHETYREVCQILENDKGIDSILVIIVKPPVNTTPKLIISEIKPLIDQSKKPYLFTLMVADNSDSGKDLFREGKIPVFSYPESMARALGNMIRYLEIKVKFIQSTPLKSESIPYPEGDSKQASVRDTITLLSDYGLKMCESKLIETNAEAIAFWKNRGSIVLKIANEDIIHKSDEGLVRLNLTTADEVDRAFNDIVQKSAGLLSDNTTPLLLAQEMIPNDIELVLGAKQDPQIGIGVMFGMGGIMVELYKDVVFRVAPLDESTIIEMIEELQGKNILSGFRNIKPVDKNVLIRAIQNFLKMVTEHPEIVEIDLNPIIWNPENNEFIVVDSRCTIVE